MFVENVNHPVTEAPQQEKRGDEHESYEKILAVGSLEHLGKLHDKSLLYDEWYLKILITKEYV
jgi:hypothetical protein